MKETLFPGMLLKERREMLGFSVEAVSRETHVLPEHIIAFESGQFANMPGNAYVLGFLRSYCRFLALEPEPFCDQYLICTRSQQNNARFNFMGRSFRPNSMDQSTPRWVNELINWGTVCIIIVIGWVTYTTVIKPIAESWRTRVDAGTVEVEVPVHFNEDL